MDIVCEQSSPDAEKNEPVVRHNGKPDADLLKPRRRHFSTIGIGEVFLSPPSPHLLPQNYVELSMKESCNFHSWEIVGRIKSTPEDFVVREISNRKIPRIKGQPSSCCNVADVVRQSISHWEEGKPEASKKEATRTWEQTTSAQNIKSEADCRGEHSLSKGNDSGDHHIADATPAGEMDKETTSAINSMSSPIDILTCILEGSLGVSGKSTVSGLTASGVLSSIQMLHRQAHARLSSLNDSHQESSQSMDPVWVPPLPREISSLGRSTNCSGGGDRGAFHRTLKVAFPLLCSKSVKRSANDVLRHDMEKQHPLWIRVSVDESLFDLVPMLLEPELDLPKLYLYRNRGCEWKNTYSHRHVSLSSRGLVMKTDDEAIRQSPKGSDGEGVVCDAMTDESQVILKLRQDMARSERRQVHQLVATFCRDLETSTIPNYHISRGVESNRGKYSVHGTDSVYDKDTTAAVVVKWSRKAQRFQKRKRSKREGSTSQGESQKNILCVLKKTKKEHLTAIQHLTTAFRCRPHDIGLAGIKDMQAVTYQFCTIRSSTLQQAKQASSYLMKKNIELGTFHVVDWTLTHGDLEGNRFEIVVRDVSRVKVCHDTELSQGAAKEILTPCEVSHVKKMVDRIREQGFLNFYGEQRLGSPGKKSEVGTRSFDIGRAMLQQDFSKAIDLLMTGRLVCRGDSLESNEVRRARRVWKDSGGEVDATLKALPTRRENMSRERTVLHGLRRYGKANPLQAIKCLPFGVRTFWINAYQSYIWNLVATERVRRFGVNVVRGDLYVPTDDNTKEVHVADEDSTGINLSQVVLPLPGYNVKYPTNEIGSLYEEILKHDNVTFRRDAPLEATAKGSYRSLVAFANKLEVELCKADSPDVFEGETSLLDNDIVKDVKFAFELKSGCYATSMLRELHCTTCER